MILTQLREATAANHKSIEGAMPLFPQIEIQAYRQLLEKFWGFYSPLEQLHSDAFSQQTKNLEMPLRKRTPSLQKDLSYFHDDKTLAALPRCADLPRYSSWPELYGGLYVIEGSSLGGQVITAHLHKMGFPQEICHFFNGYGAMTGKMWQGFLKELQAHVLSNEERALAVKAAQDTFMKLEKWLRAS
ncbi:hypothetical protein AZI86_11960 [Bdellovibrio bacteriovorus]|uniref:Heme oxygenase n=1 Tax=Bdellovibrio bacteriovorus TaxID=959 RepID=A0A150WM84_BDEBC|nr:biliverdin-producing heme oxygenase [Bdellovibrio bacteriovorus]KYG64907.1 hypothetical protein AZI86_11960 [Bdellovibrio bacteriovorus]